MYRYIKKSLLVSGHLQTANLSPDLGSSWLTWGKSAHAWT